MCVSIVPVLPQTKCVAVVTVPSSYVASDAVHRLGVQESQPLFQGALNISIVCIPSADRCSDALHLLRMLTYLKYLPF